LELYNCLIGYLRLYEVHCVLEFNVEMIIIINKNYKAIIKVIE